MALSPRVDLRQTQFLAMTPKLLQSMKLLQMSVIELEAYISEELEKNPLLEQASDMEKIENFEDFPSFDSSYIDHFSQEEIPDAEKIADTFDASIENIYPDDSGDRFYEPVSTRLSGSDTNDFDFLQNIAQTKTLKDHIREQIAFAFESEAERFVAMQIADLIEDNGYFTDDLDALATRLGWPLSKLETILDTMKDFDPAGLFACDLCECLSLQLRRKDRLDPAMKVLLNHLPALAKRDFIYLKQQCGVGEDDLLDMLDEIRALDPKPGMAFSVSGSNIIVPEVLITDDGYGGFHIEVNSDVLPRLVVNNCYSARLAKDGEEKAFMSNCLKNANWLIHALDQRARTLLKVSQEIVRVQENFLRHGIAHLKPLTLASLAEAVNMHESTMSRVTANKFISTPRGTFAMRHFFSAALQDNDGGEAHAAEAVRFRIRQLIDGEGVDNILSDDALVSILKGEGIDIARRTVAKYREAMNIASSISRRREKKLRQGG